MRERCARLSGLSDDTVREYLLAAQRYAASRIKYAQVWQVQYNILKNEWAATQATIDITKDALTMYKAKMLVAEKRLGE